jgi:hypothetical protein
LSASFRVDAEAQFHSQKEDAEARTSASEDRATSAFGLTAEKDDSGETSYKVKDRKATVYEVLYTPSVSLDLDQSVRGLSVTTFIEYDNIYNPYIEVDANTGDRETVYEPARKTWTYLQLTYKVNETLKFDNYFAVVQEDLYGKSGDQDKINYENLARLSYTMY